MSSISRRLSLHASALSDDEYQLYTTSLLSIVSVEEDGVSENTGDDGYYEKMNVNVRETRAWIRGRYSHISSVIIDKILKLFSPNLSATDSLSGGEFFAVLRLVVHAENGKEVDRSLAFVQAQVRPPPNSVPARRTYTDPSLATSPPSVVESSSSHNPFTSNHHPQPPPLHPSQRSEPASHNPFVHRTLPPPTRSDDGNAKLPPLPPRKPPVPPIPQPSPMIAAPLKYRSHPDRSRSPSKPISTPNPLISSHSHPPHPPTIPPKPIHHITSTLIKQSLQATKAAQTMKKAEEQLERERVMQVLKSSSTVSGTNVYNQHQYQRQQRRSPSPSPMTGHGHGGGGSGGGPLKKLGYATSSTSSGSDERAPPLPKRRTQQPSPPLSISSLEQVALATTRPYPTSAPPSSTVSAFPNTEISNHAHVRLYPNMTSHRSRDQVDPTTVIPYTSSPERSPKRVSLDLPAARGRPPPTHPDRKPHHLQYEYQRFSNSHPHRSQSYSDPFTGDVRDPPREEHTTNVDESFESIYGPSTSSPFANPIPPSPQTISNPNRASRSKSLHQPVPLPRSSVGRKRPESVQVFRASDVGLEEDGTGPPLSPNWNSNSGNLSRHTSLMTPANTKIPHRRSSLSISSTHSSSSSSVNHSGNWPPPSPHRQTQFGGISSSSSLSGPHPRAPSSTSSMTMKPDHSNSISTPPNPLTSLQKTFLQIQPHLDKARYKAEAGLSKRGFVRDGLRNRSGSGGVNGDGDEEEDGLEDGLEGLIGGSSDGGGGKNQVGKSRWHDGSRASDGGNLDRVYDREVDQDSDWTRSEGMSMPSDSQGRVQRQYSDGEDGDGPEKDNLKWPVASGEGWKPL